MTKARTCGSIAAAYKLVPRVEVSEEELPIDVLTIRNKRSGDLMLCCIGRQRGLVPASELPGHVDTGPEFNVKSHLPSSLLHFIADSASTGLPLLHSQNGGGGQGVEAKERNFSYLEGVSMRSGITTGTRPVEQGHVGRTKEHRETNQAGNKASGSFSSHSAVGRSHSAVGSGNFSSSDNDRGVVVGHDRGRGRGRTSIIGRGSSNNESKIGVGTDAGKTSRTSRTFHTSHTSPTQRLRHSALDALSDEDSFDELEPEFNVFVPHPPPNSVAPVVSSRRTATSATRAHTKSIAPPANNAR